VAGEFGIFGDISRGRLFPFRMSPRSNTRTNGELIGSGNWRDDWHLLAQRNPFPRTRFQCSGNEILPKIFDALNKAIRYQHDSTVDGSGANLKSWLFGVNG